MVEKLQMLEGGESVRSYTERTGVEPGEALELYTAALVRYRGQIAAARGISEDRLHQQPQAA